MKIQTITQKTIIPWFFVLQRQEIFDSVFLNAKNMATLPSIQDYRRGLERIDHIHAQLDHFMGTMKDQLAKLEQDALSGIDEHNNKVDNSNNSYSGNRNLFPDAPHALSTLMQNRDMLKY